MKISLLASVIMALALASAAHVAQAQESTNSDSDSAVQQVVVTSTGCTPIQFTVLQEAVAAPVIFQVSGPATPAWKRPCVSVVEGTDPKATTPIRIEPTTINGDSPIIQGIKDHLARAENYIADYERSSKHRTVAFNQRWNLMFKPTRPGVYTIYVPSQITEGFAISMIQLVKDNGQVNPTTVKSLYFHSGDHGAFKLPEPVVGNW